MSRTDSTRVGPERPWRFSRGASARTCPVAPEEHGAGDGRGAEPVAHVVERGVERGAVVAIERERELHGAVVVEVGDGDADQREPVLAR